MAVGGPSYSSAFSWDFDRIAEIIGEIVQGLDSWPVQGLLNACVRQTVPAGPKHELLPTIVMQRAAVPLPSQVVWAGPASNVARIRQVDRLNARQPVQGLVKGVGQASTLARQPVQAVAGQITQGASDV